MPHVVGLNFVLGITARTINKKENLEIRTLLFLVARLFRKVYKRKIFDIV